MSLNWRSTLGLFLFYTIWLGSIAFTVTMSFVFVIVPSARIPLAVLLCMYVGILYLFPLRRWQWFCDSVRWFNESSPYFKEQKIVFDDGGNPCPAKSKTLLSYHPHGILVCGWTVNGAAHSAWKDSAVRWLATDILFILPFVAQIMYWAGGGPAGRESFESIAKNGDNIGLLPGGFEEASLFKYKTHRVFIRNRKGFIKLALKYGYKVQPIYTFGEEDTFWTLLSFEYLRLWLNKYKIPAVVFCGNWWCPYMPYSSARLVTVVGKAIELPQLDSPTKEDVDKYHALYVDALEKLFDKHKTQYASDPKATLEVL